MRLAVALAFLSLTAAGCSGGGPLYATLGSPSQVTVDGQTTEWPAALRPVPREAALSIGLRRDADALAVVVVAGDARQAQTVALGGLRLWLDPAAGEDRVLGVRFPAPAPLGDRTLRALRPGGPDDPLRRRFESSLGTVEITQGPTEDRDVALTRRAPVGSVAGLETAATWERDRLVVEMRVPLSAMPGLLPDGAAGPLGVGVEIIDLQQTVATRRAAQGRLPRRGETPDTGDRPGPSADAPAPQVETVTRWFRID